MVHGFASTQTLSLGVFWQSFFGERATQEYLAIKQDLAKPDPSRLAYRRLTECVSRAAHAFPATPRIPMGQCRSEPHCPDAAD